MTPHIDTFLISYSEAFFLSFLIYTKIVVYHSTQIVYTLITYNS